VSAPRLNPMPGRVIVKMVERLDKFPGSRIALESRYIYQPYIGTILDVGEATTEREEKLRAILLARRESGERCIFSPANGMEFGTKEMCELTLYDEARPEGFKPFAWLTDIRLFRIDDFAATLVGGNELGGVGEMPVAQDGPIATEPGIDYSVRCVVCNHEREFHSLLGWCNGCGTLTKASHHFSAKKEVLWTA